MAVASFVGVLFVPPLFVAFTLLSRRLVRLVRRRQEHPAE
jgi:hypothetical protein